MKRYKNKFKVGDILNYLNTPVKVLKADYSTVYNAPVYDIEYITVDENGNCLKLESVHQTFLKP